MLSNLAGFHGGLVRRNHNTLEHYVNITDL